MVDYDSQPPSADDQFSAAQARDRYCSPKRQQIPVLPRGALYAYTAESLRDQLPRLDRINIFSMSRNSIAAATNPFPGANRAALCHNAPLRWTSDMCPGSSGTCLTKSAVSRADCGEFRLTQ